MIFQKYCKGEDYGKFEKRLKKEIGFNCIMLVVFALLILTDIYYRKKY